MSGKTKSILLVAVLVTFASLTLWRVTGGDYYTKYEVVEQVEKAVDPNDPLAAAGFYEGSSQTETVTRKDFRFGLLPTPSSLLDKHALSVVSVNGLIWTVAVVMLWISYRRRKAPSQPPAT